MAVGDGPVEGEARVRVDEGGEFGVGGEEGFDFCGWGLVSRSAGEGGG